MLEIFKMAERTRNPKFKEVPLKSLMEEAAEEAGWHLEYIPNLQTTPDKKYAVRYDQPFSEEVASELMCRLRGPVMSFLSKRDIDPTLIDSFVSYGFFNFIKTYKPKIHNTEEKIYAAVYESVRCKVDQGNRNERFKYRYTPPKSEDEKKVNLTRYGNVRKEKYKNSPKEFSIYTEIRGKDGGNDSEFINFMVDEELTPCDIVNEMEETELLFDTYSNNPSQRVILQILVEAGKHGKLFLRELQEEALESKVVVKTVKQELEESLNKFKERARIKVKAQEELERIESLKITQKMVEDKVNRKVKGYYRELKKILQEKL